MEITESKISSKKCLVWSAAALILLAAISGILTLHRWSDASHKVVHLLSQLESQANRLSALEWKAMARKSLTAEIRHGEQSIRQQLSQTFVELNRYVDAQDLQYI